MALEVIQRPEEELFTQENPTIYDTPYYTSRFNAANLPLVYKITNTKFPVNSEDAIEDISSVSNNGGFAQLVLNSATYNFLNKGYVEVTNTNSYNGVWQIIEDIDSDNIVINAPFVANETGNVQNYYNNYSTLVKVYSGLPEYHTLNSTKPMTLITDNPITVTPNSDNEAIIDVSALVKSQLNLNNDYDVNDIDLFNAFYIEYSEQYDESDGTTVSVTTELFAEDVITGCDAGGANFVTNGDFATDLSGWTQSLAGVTWIFDTGSAQVTLDTSNRSSQLLLQSTLGLTEGVEYDLSFDYVLGSENVTIIVFNGNTVYEESLTGTGTVSTTFIASDKDSIGFVYILNSSPASPVDLRLDNVNITNELVNPCLAYIFSSHSALQPQSKYGGNMGEYVQNFNGGVFANKWLTLMQEPVLFKGNYFDLSTIIPQSVIQAAVQSGGYFLEIVEYDVNGDVIAETQVPITDNLGDGIYRFRLDNKTFQDNTKGFTVQILRIPVNLFVDGDQGTFNTTSQPGGNPPSDWNLQKDINYRILFDNTKSFAGSGSLRFEYFNVSESFIFDVQTTTTSETFNLPLISTGTYDFFIDWGDGTTERITTYNQSEVTHTYTSAGTYEIIMNGTINGFEFNNEGDKLKIQTIKQWGTIICGSGAFYGCSNLNITATDTLLGITNLQNFFRGCTNLVFNSSINNWDVSNVENFTFTFLECPNFNQPLNLWNTIKATDMLATFADCVLFNQNINTWNVSNVTTMQQMFSRCTNFNQPLDNWNVSSVTTMAGMFRDNNNFNQNIGAWNVSNVNNMNSMFRGALAFNNGGSNSINNWNTSSLTRLEFTFLDTSNFNQPLGNWNVSNVVTLFGTFSGNTIFNQNLNTWNTGSCPDMRQTFQGCTAFNQPLDNWNVSVLTNALGFLNGTSFSTVNYDALLIGWEAQLVQNNVTLDANNSQYTAGSAAAEARQRLITDHSWTINDGGAI